MIGKSIYVPDNPALRGGSPQAVHEQLWAQGRRRRLQTRGVLAGVGLVAGTWLVALWAGLLLALLIAGVDTAVRWRERATSSVWRKGQRGERRTARILKLLQWRGYEVVHGRMAPGIGQLDTLLIGPAGVFLIDNRAVAPDTTIAEYGGTLYVNERSGAKLSASLREMSDAAGSLLAERMGEEVEVEAIGVVYGGTLRRGGVSAEGITLLRSYELLSWIRRRGVHRGPEELEAICEAARLLPISRQALVVR
jgi:hypothetical protein